MALTQVEYLTPTGETHRPPDLDLNLYYDYDMRVVSEQDDVDTVGLLVVTYAGERLVVFAAKDNNGVLLDYAAVPCPPYHHEDRGVYPGELLDEYGESTGDSL